MSTTNTSSAAVPVAVKKSNDYIDEEEKKVENEIKRLAYFLRGRKGIKVRNGIELGKRVEYIKGDKLASFILKNKAKCKPLWSKEINEKNDILPIGQALLRFGYIHRSERSTEKKKVLKPSETQTFVLDGYYTWMYEGSKVLRNVLSALLIIGFFIATCFPIWPYWAKIALWYVSVTMLIIMISFSLVRLIIFFALWLIGMEFWIFPNLFDDTLSVVDSFKPVYSFQKTPKQDRIYRLLGFAITVIFCVWIYNQPTDFDDYLNLTKQFTDDIYSGKLLSDIAEQRNNPDGIKPFNVPDLQKFMKDEEDSDDDTTESRNVEEEENSNEEEKEQIKDEM